MRHARSLIISIVECEISPCDEITTLFGDLRVIHALDAFAT